MQHLDEGTIHAWIDGALSSDEASRVDAHVASCAACAAKVADARGLVAASSRIVSALDVTPSGVLPAFGAKKARPWWSIGMSVGAAMAATLVIAIGYGVIGRTAKPDAVTRVAVDTASPRALETPKIALPPQATPVAAPMTASIAAPIDSSKLTVAQGTADSTTRAEARRRMVIVSDSVRPIPAPMGVLRAQVSGASMNGGAGGGRGGAQPQPVAPAVTAFVPSSGRAARVTLVGCYEADQSTDVLPRRFALRADSVGGNEVRYVDSTGAIDGRIADLDWIDAPGRAIIRSIGRGPIMTIVRTPAAITAQSTLGPRSIRSIVCSG
jgi:anti-sigma factor RsiW